MGNQACGSKPTKERQKYYILHKGRENLVCKLYHARKRKALLDLDTDGLIDIFNKGSRYCGAKSYTYSRYNGYQLKIHRVIYAIATGCTLRELEGIDIHHMDENIHNNRFQNLEAIEHGKHTTLRWRQ